jgi:hypothetical protein
MFYSGGSLSVCRFISNQALKCLVKPVTRLRMMMISNISAGLEQKPAPLLALQHPVKATPDITRNFVMLGVL